MDYQHHLFIKYIVNRRELAHVNNAKSCCCRRIKIKNYVGMNLIKIIFLKESFNVFILFSIHTTTQNDDDLGKEWKKKKMRKWKMMENFNYHDTTRDEMRWGKDFHCRCNKADTREKYHHRNLFFALKVASDKWVTKIKEQVRIFPTAYTRILTATDTVTDDNNDDNHTPYSLTFFNWNLLKWIEKYSSTEHNANVKFCGNFRKKKKKLTFQELIFVFFLPFGSTS